MASRSSTSTEKFKPTPEEKEVIDRANMAFVKGYLSGICAGVGVGFIGMSGRFKFSNFQRWMLMLGCSLTGESVGRQLGTHRAKVILQKDLPHSSALRHMLKEQFPDTVAPTALTGPSLDGAELQEVPVTGGNSTSSRPVSPSTAPVSPSNSPWDQVRKQAGPPPSIWDQIRNGQQPVTPPSPGLDQQDVDDLIMEMNSDSKSNSASVSAPSSSKLRTKGESGLIPRTLEEMQEAEKAGTVKRNKYGDIME